MDGHLRMLPITEFRERAKEIVDTLDEGDVILVRHSRPVAALVRPEQLARLYARIEDLEDELALAQATGDLVPLDIARKELGLAD